MGTKNIAISEGAYQRLRALKKEGESFTNVIERITRSDSILELAGVLSKREGRDVRKRVQELRDQGSLRVRREVERLAGLAR